MANNNFDQQTFRLAAVLYVDNNYEVSTKTIHKKIIESVFLGNQNKPLNIHEIIDFIEKQNCIVLDPLEVQNVLTGGNDSTFNLGRNVKCQMIQPSKTTKTYHYYSKRDRYFPI